MRALEESCATAERALSTGDWETLTACLQDQRRLQHALQNVLHASRGKRDPSAEKRLFDRLSRIGLTRDRHIGLLEQSQREIQTRLSALNSWKRAARKWLGGFEKRRSNTIDQMR